MELTTGETVTVVGGLLVVIGAFLPWVSTPVVSPAGIDGDGVYSLAFGILALAVVLFRRWERLDAAGVALFGVLTLAVGLNTFTSLSGQIAGTISFSLTPGIGLYMTLFGGLVLLAGPGYSLLRSEFGAGEGAVGSV
jgi:vacuolar-type H+-ATPase subunit I/STV1